MAPTDANQSARHDVARMMSQQEPRGSSRSGSRKIHIGTCAGVAKVPKLQTPCAKAVTACPDGKLENASESARNGDKIERIGIASDKRAASVLISNFKNSPANTEPKGPQKNNVLNSNHRMPTSTDFRVSG